MLQDVEFLYRVEVGTPVEGLPGTFKLDDHEVAMRLSYFLWGTTPSDALLDLADVLRLARRSADAADAARSALADAGLLEHMHAVVGADAVGAYKPDPRVYRHALDVLGLDADETWFVAGHWWDVAGAKRVGLRTAWLARDEGALLASAPEPDVRAADLKEAAEAIAAAT
jgi:2-haloacid dehalogenase